MIEVIKINAKWSIEIERISVYPAEPFTYISGYISDGWTCIGFSRYSHNGKIAYDFPERIPAYVKTALTKKLERIDNGH